MTPDEAIRIAEMIEAETCYRNQLAAEMYARGRQEAQTEAELRYEHLTRPADDAVAALDDRRWGPGGRAHFADPRPGDFPGRARLAEPEAEAAEIEIA